MVDVGTGLAALGGAELSKEMLAKLLGPTADYVGVGVQAWTEKRLANVRAVFGSDGALRTDTMLSLERHRLVAPAWRMGEAKDLQTHFGPLDFPEGGIVYTITQQGVAL